MADTIHMKRDPEVYPAPHEADVHPDEVENYRVGGWEPSEPSARKPRAKKVTS